MIPAILEIVAGVALLYFGAEFLVRGGVRIATGLGVTPLVIGLTLVAFATSAPELVVSVTGALRGSGDLAVGNVVGSNICNIALILGRRRCSVRCRSGVSCCGSTCRCCWRCRWFLP